MWNWHGTDWKLLYSFFHIALKSIISFDIITFDIMNNTDPRIDNYILKSADFAVPILIHLRELIHIGCPEIKETVKWSFPNFEYKGSILCSMASFKQHCAFGFWLGSLMDDPHGLLTTGNNKTAMGNLGQIKSLEDLPSDDIMIQYIRHAKELIDKGIKLPKKAPASATKELEIPDYFAEALKTNKKATATFDAFSYSNKKEYVEWVTEAKSEDTRNKRLATAIEWLAEGKIKNWKYVRS